VTDRLGGDGHALETGLAGLDAALRGVIGLAPAP
jgi:hypothetical protein